MFKKVFKSAKRLEKKNLMEAVVAASVLVAAADGEIEKEEIKKLDRLLSANDLLSAFPKSEISKTVNRYSNVLEADFALGRVKMLKEIREIADNQEEAENAFLTALAVAKADGEIDEKEKKVIAGLASELGLRIEDYVD